MGNNWIKELEKLEGKLETITNDYKEGIETKESELLKIYAIELRIKDVIVIIENIDTIVILYYRSGMGNPMLLEGLFFELKI